MDADSPSVPRTTPNFPFRYVLYVHAACANSKSILQLLKDTIPQQGVVKVQPIETIGSLDSLPPWLDGTPICVDSINGTIYRGQEAFHAIAHVAMDINDQMQMQDKSMAMAHHEAQPQPHPHPQPQPQPQQPVFTPSPQQAPVSHSHSPAAPDHRQRYRETQSIKLSTEGWGDGNTPTISIE